MAMQLHKPEEVGMSSRRLARIAPVMEEFVKDNRLPGIMTLVQRRGKVVHLGKYGLMDIDAGRPMEEDALFRIASMTKPIVSVALMMLYEEGAFSLNDPVASFIPAFGKTRVYTGSSPLGMVLVNQDPIMSLYHLLTHTAGLSYGWFLDSPVEEMYRQKLVSPRPRDISLEAFIDELASLPLLCQPGSQWRYSYATDVLGRVIEVVAGMPLAAFLEQRIFEPLGMVDTAFHVTPDKVHRLAPLYMSPKLYGPVLPDEDSVADVTTPTSCPSGGGGLISTLGDYLSFCNCLIQDGRYPGGRLISGKTVAWMTANHIPPRLMPLKVGPMTADIGFGLGVGMTTSLGTARSLTSVGSYGWRGSANTSFWIDPAEALIGLLMTQHMPGRPPHPARERFQNLAYQAIDE